MKKSMCLLLALPLLSCSTTNTYALKGTLSIENDATITVKGYFQNGIDLKKSDIKKGFYYENVLKNDEIIENFYLLDDYQNLEDKIRMTSNLWTFDDVTWNNDNSNILLTLEISNLGNSSITSKIIDNRGDNYLIDCPSKEINSGSSGQMILELKKSKEICLERLPLKLQIRKDANIVETMREKINKNVITYDDFTNKPVTDINCLIYGQKYTNMLGDMKRDSVYEKKSTTSNNIEVFPHQDKSLSDKYTNSVGLNFIKDHYYFFALDLTKNDFDLYKTQATIRFFPSTGGINLRYTYANISENRVVIITKYTLEETENIKFSMCFGSQYIKDTGTITLHSMMVVDLGLSPSTYYENYIETLKYFSYTKSTSVKIMYYQNEMEKEIGTFNYDDNNLYYSFSYIHRPNGRLVIETLDGLSIDYDRSYLSYGFYLQN